MPLVLVGQGDGVGLARSHVLQGELEVPAVVICAALRPLRYFTAPVQIAVERRGGEPLLGRLGGLGDAAGEALAVDHSRLHLHRPPGIPVLRVGARKSPRLNSSHVAISYAVSSWTKKRDRL